MAPAPSEPAPDAGLPDDPWLCRDLLRRWIARVGRTVEQRWRGSIGELASIGPMGGDLGQYLVASLFDLRTDSLERDAYLAYFDAALEQHIRGLPDVAPSRASARTVV